MPDTSKAKALINRAVERRLAELAAERADMEAHAEGARFREAENERLRTAAQAVLDLAYGPVQPIVIDADPSWRDARAYINALNNLREALAAQSHSSRNGV